jgi:hypothetical protein
MSKVKKSSDTITFENYLTIEVIDRNTGKVKQRVVVKNVALQPLAKRIAEEFFKAQGTPTYNNSNYYGANYINLFNPTKGYIKSLSGSWASLVDTGSAMRNTLSVGDSSTDSYTVQYLILSYGTQSSYGAIYNAGTVVSYFAVALPSAITKGSTDVLSFSWTCQVKYSAPP